MYENIKQRLEILYQLVETLEQSAGEGYSRAEADQKFLSKTDAAEDYLTKSSASTTYLSKTDAASTYVDFTDYATQNTSGVIKAWTTTSGDVITLHIATQDNIEAKVEKTIEQPKIEEKIKMEDEGGEE